MGKLDGKIALITGGNSGMGEAFSVLFAKEGAEVVIVGRDQEKGRRVVRHIETIGAKACFMECDVTNRTSINKLKEMFVARYNTLDILVNNAGILITDPIEKIKEEDWLKVFDTNTHSIMRVTQAFLDLILKSHGNILINASIDGLQYMNRGRTNYAYAASKAATIKFAQQLALNYTVAGIRVNCLCPGVTETPFFTNRDFSRFIDAIPMGRVGRPEEIAKAACFLVSDDASYVSGAVLTVDGAASLK